MRVDLLGQVSGFMRKTHRTINNNLKNRFRECVRAERGYRGAEIREGWGGVRVSADPGRLEKVSVGRRGWRQWWSSLRRATWAQNLV